MKFTAPKPQDTTADPQSRPLMKIAITVGAAIVLLLGLAMVSVEGCRTDNAELAQRDRRGEEGLQGAQTHLVRAVTLLEHVEDFEQGQAISLIMSQLGQWIADEPPLDEWSVDPLIGSLPKPAADILDQQQLPMMQFTIQDYFYLSEALWAHNIAQWQAAERSDRRQRLQERIDKLDEQLTPLAEDAAQRPALEAQRARLQEELEPSWLAGLRKQRGDRTADELALAAQLFDWTVRNIQLDKTNWDSALPDEANLSAAEREAPIKVPPPPPGAELHAWEAMLLGRGDAAHRGRVFLLLARQQGIEVVMLGLTSKAVDGEPRPWAAGVVLGDEIYVFDPELGLPIPGPNDEGIATLAMLRAQPELLRQLDLPDAPYPVTAEDLKHLVALIDAPPQALAQRMLLVEQKLPDEHSLKLTVGPSKVQKRVRKLGLEESRIWAVPYRVFQYDLLRQRDAEANNRFNLQKAVYNSALPLFPARMHHFRGQFDAEPPDMGAKAYYLFCRTPNREIDKIRSAPELRKEMIARNPNLEQHADVLNALVAEAQRSTIQAKQQATYWLGLVATEDDDLGAAVDYLAKRTLDIDPDSPWTYSARYNIARIYEATGQHDQAIALYDADDSPQWHGNRIRARRLRGERLSSAP